MKKWLLLACVFALFLGLPAQAATADRWLLLEDGEGEQTFLDAFSVAPVSESVKDKFAMWRKTVF
ncbi:MAG: hypothetical protein LBP78_03985 [Acidaminococcales bacterium]|jgi:hypothetical protein|nr:hypothetical protein [Acidaminococcales bacterium]